MLFAIVLAAGASSRFGATKQLARVGGETMVLRAVRSAEAVCAAQTVLVTGKDWREVAAACEPLQGFMARNTEFRDGLSSSIRAGIGSVREVAAAVLLVLADQPLVTPGHLHNLAQAWRLAPERIVASGYAGISGPPVIFPRDLFAPLMSLHGDRGARKVIEANRDRLTVIDFPPAATDIDRPADLGNL